MKKIVVVLLTFTLLLSGSIVYADPIDLDHMDVLFSKGRDLSEEDKADYKSLLEGFFSSDAALEALAGDPEGYLPDSDLDKMKSLGITMNDLSKNLYALIEWSSSDRMKLIEYGLMDDIDAAKTKIQELNNKYTEVDPPVENEPEDNNDNGGSTSGGGSGGFIPPSQPVNEFAPKVIKDTYTITMNEPISIHIDELLENDEKADTFVSVDGAMNGSVIQVGSMITFTPKKDYWGRGIFYYKISNDEGEDRGPVLIEIEKEQILEIGIDQTPLSLGELKDRRQNRGLIYQAIEVSKPNKTFQDVENHWAKEYVEFFSQREILNGRTEESFEPEGLIKESEIIKFIMAVTVNSEEQIIYEDITLEEAYENQWYSEYIKQAKALDLLSDDAEIKPDEYPTREKIIAWIVEGLQVLEVEITEDMKTYSGDFTDFNEVDEAYKEAVIIAHNLGIISGNANGTLTPRRNIKRGEVAKMMNEFYKIVLAEE